MRLFLAALLAMSSAVSCARFAPVERHFMSIPAGAVGGLSSIDRKRWIKANRKQNDDHRAAAAAGWLELGPYGPLAGASIWFRPHETHPGLATIVTDISASLARQGQLRLHVRQGTHYRDVTKSVLRPLLSPPSRWQSAPDHTHFLGFSSTDRRPTAALYWQQNWRAQPLR
jgi:hypothetical protein